MRPVRPTVSPALVSSALAAALAALVGLSCASPPDEKRATSVGFFEPELVPSYAQFKQGRVSYFLERRCGTLDCHGQAGRPLRIYGHYGLRLPNQAGLRPTSGDTSEEEVAANYRSVVGLQPEVINRVVLARAEGNCALEGEPDVPCLHHLLLVAKPLSCNLNESVGCNDKALGVEHKGGPIIARGDDGYACLLTWIQGITDGVKCERAGSAY